QRFGPRLGFAQVEFLDLRQVGRTQERYQLVIAGAAPRKAETTQAFQLRSGGDLRRIDLGLVDAEQLQIADGQVAEQLLGVTQKLAHTELDRFDESADEFQVGAQFLERSQPLVAVLFEEFSFSLRQR